MKRMKIIREREEGRLGKDLVNKIKKKKKKRRYHRARNSIKFCLVTLHSLPVRIENKIFSENNLIYTTFQDL